MAAEIFEVQTSRNVTYSWASPSADLEWIITGTADESSAATLAAATISTSYLGMLLKNYTITPAIGSLPNGIVGIWSVKARYERVANRVEWTWDTTGASIKRMKSISTETYIVDATAAEIPDYNGVIGVKDDGTAEGVDIVARACKINCSITCELGFLPENYPFTVEDLTGKVNSDMVTISYGGFSVSYEAGEVLFQGGIISQASDGAVRVNLRFERRPNRNDVEVGDVNDIVMEGHQYIWTKNRIRRDGAALSLVPRPYGAYVETVYDPASFTDLMVFT